MSSKAKKILALTLIAVVMGSFGFYLGKKLKYKLQNQPQATVQKKETKKDNKLYKSDYELIKPDLGPIIQTLDVDVEYTGDTATFTITTDNALKLRLNQQVILLDDEGFILPLGGKIIGLTANEGIIQLPEDTKTEFLNPTLTIITTEISNTKRLPINVVEQDENGAGYIWIARSEGDGYRINRQYIDIENAFKGESFVEIDNKISLSDLIIFNPDDSIKSNRLYEMTEIDLERPLLNPIRQAWLNYERFRVEEFDEKQREITENCYKGIPHPDVQPNEGAASYEPNSMEACGSSTQARDPMDIFNEILNRGTNGGSACGGGCGG